MLSTKRSQSGLAVLLALAVAGIASAPGAARADVVYVSGGQNEFGTLDLSTGAFSQIGTFSLPTGSTMFGMGAIGPGALAGVDAVGEAYFINPTNAATTDLGNTGTFPVGGGGNGSPILYVFDDSTATLTALDFAHFTTTTIGTYPSILGDGLVAVGPDGSVYVGGQITGAPDELFKINPTTMAVTDLGSTGASNFLYSGVFVGSTLYAFDSGGRILTLDTTTGASTFVTNYSLPGNDIVYAAAYLAPVPEPSSVALLGLGVAGVVGLGARRRLLRAASAA